MAQIEQILITTGVLNVLVGIVFTIAVYTALERVPTLAGVLGFLLAAGIVSVQAWLGESFLTVTVAEMKLLVIVAVLGAALGIAGITTVFEPTTN